MSKVLSREQLIKELTKLSTRLTYHPRIQEGDRDLLEQTINYLQLGILIDMGKRIDQAIELTELETKQDEQNRGKKKI